MSGLSGEHAPASTSAIDAGLPLARLRRLLAPAKRATAAELLDQMCQGCGATLEADHRHMVDVASRSLVCVCGVCHAASVRSGPDADRHRAVPRRYVRVPEAAISDAQWDALEIPVGIAFFFRNSTLERIVASYPSPAGAIESVLPADAWEHVLGAHPWMRLLAPDVEALLVRRTREARDSFVVPIDACYELAGRIRQRWSGFGGGAAVRDEIDGFFMTLRERSLPASP
jgi:hypothetical protein